MSLRTPISVTRLSNGTPISTLLTAADVAGDTFANTGKEFVVVANGGVGSITVTIVSQKVVDGDLAVGDPTVVIANGATRIFGPFPPSVYNDASGLLSMTYTGVTTVTMGVMKFVAETN